MPRIAIPIPHSSERLYSAAALDRFARALSAYGAEIVIIPLESKIKAIKMLGLSEGLLLPGSPADIDPSIYGGSISASLSPADGARDEMDYALLEPALRDSKPVLGICHGLQNINVFFGGSLRHGIPSQEINHAVSEDERESHPVIVDHDSTFGQIFAAPELRPQSFLVNSNHHQAVNRVGGGLKVCARSPDGVIEALEAVDNRAFLLGVQWHPEGLKEGRIARENIFARFVDEAAKKSVRLK